MHSLQLSLRRAPGKPLAVIREAGGRRSLPRPKGLHPTNPQTPRSSQDLDNAAGAPNPGPAALRRAYRRAALRWHPDRFGRRVAPRLPEAERPAAAARVAGLAQQVRAWLPQSSGPGDLGYPKHEGAAAARVAGLAQQVGRPGSLQS